MLHDDMLTESAYLVANTANTFYSKVFPGNAHMFVCETRAVGGSGGGGEVRAQVELFMRLALLDILLVRGLRPLGVGLLGSDRKDSLKLIELGLGLGNVDVMGVWQRCCVAAEGAIIRWSIRHGARTRLSELASGKGRKQRDGKRVFWASYILNVLVIFVTITVGASLASKRP